MVYISVIFTHYISQIACRASEPLRAAFHVLCAPPVLWLVGTPQASVSKLMCLSLIYPCLTVNHLSLLGVQHLCLHFWCSSMEMWAFTTYCFIFNTTMRTRSQISDLNCQFGQLLIYLSQKQFIQVEMCGSILHGDWLSRNIYLFWNRRSKSLSWILTCYMTKLNLKFNFPNNSILGTVQAHMIYIVGCWGVVQLGGQILVLYKSFAQAWIVLLMELNSIRLIGLLVKYEKYETLSINYK